MGLFERLRESLWRVGNGDQVHMIRHEAVAEQGERVQSRMVPQQFKVSEALGIGGENNLSCISALRNVMGNVDDHDAG
jgi:hypothetical protein